jgi:RNA polymerase sigma-70 factor (ECF subfamily)
MTQKAFLSLVMPLQEKLFHFAYHFLGNEEEAKDAVQDSLVKIWEKRELLAVVNNVEAWCIRVTKNMLLDKVRYNRYRATVRLSADTEQAVDHNVSGGKIELNDSVNIVRGIIHSLPTKQKLLIQLRDIEGFAYSEIAEIMELSLADVKIGIFRARQAIREKIQNLNSYGLR